MSSTRWAGLLDAAALAVGVSLIVLFCSSEGVCADSTFIKGADVSFLEEIESKGGLYTEGGEPCDLVDIVRRSGFNYVRLRVWHSPARGYCDLGSTLDMAARARARGFGLLIDFHYSDTWADPRRQVKPAAWSGVTGRALRDSVRGYTAAVIAALRGQGTLPDIVQVGNEVTCGMLWDDGRICDSFDGPRQWSELRELIAAAILGVEDAAGEDHRVRIMIHIDRGGDNKGSRWFLDHRGG